MKRNVLHAIQLLALVGLANLLACSFEASFKASVSVRISANARVLSTDVNKKTEIAPEQLTIPANSIEGGEFKPGEILVSEDFVRKVVSSSPAGENVIVKTNRASLEEVIEQGEFAATYDISSEQEVAGQFGGASPKATWSGRGFDVVLDRRSILLDEATNARIWLDGSLSFRPLIDIHLKFGPTYAHAIARGTLDAKLNVTASAAMKKSYTKSVLLWESQPFTMPLGHVGPVPIKFKAKLAIRALLAVNATGKVIVTTGYVFHGAGGYGFRYQDGAMNAVEEWETSGELSPPVVTSTGTFDVHAGLRAEIDGGLNGDVFLASATGGLRLSTEMYGDAHVDPINWSARLGVRADASAFLEVVALAWSREFVTKPLEIFNRPLISWPTTATAPSAQAACSGASPITCGASFDPKCSACKDTERCVIASDCASKFCYGGYCFPSEVYSKAAGEECTADWSCSAGLSCATEIQPDRLIRQICRPDHCSDELANADESDRDCGGGCRPCLEGFGCRTKDDCASGVCEWGYCGR